MLKWVKVAFLLLWTTWLPVAARYVGNVPTVLNLRAGGGDDSKSVDWRYFVAGGICAACSHGITTPIDVVKTKMQTSPEKYTKGVLAAAKSIVAEEGVGILLAGLGEIEPFLRLTISHKMFRANCCWIWFGGGSEIRVL